MTLASTCPALTRVTMTMVLAAAAMIVGTATACSAADQTPRLTDAGELRIGDGASATVADAEDGWVMTGAGTIADGGDRLAARAYEVTGNFEFIARVAPQQGATGGYVGLTIMADDKPEGRRGFVGISADPESDRNFMVAYRQIAGAAPDVKRPRRGNRQRVKWLKIVRAGNTISYYWSVDGTQWQGLYSHDFVPELPKTVRVGLTVVADESVEATFTGIAARPFDPTYPILWFGASNPTVSGHIQEGLFCLDYSAENNLLYGSGFAEHTSASVYTDDGDRLFGDRRIAHFRQCREILAHGGRIYGTFMGGGLVVWNEFFQGGRRERFMKDSKFAGLDTDGRYLYAADQKNEEIRVIDPAERNEVRSWPMKRPGMLQFDDEGTLWIVQRAEEAFIPIRANAGSTMLGWRRTHGYIKGGKWRWKTIDEERAEHIDTSGLENPAPLGVYRSWLGGDHSYSTGTRGGTGYMNRDLRYKIRVHMLAPLPKIADGEHVFDILVNGEVVAENFDLVAEAGGYLKPVIKEFIAKPTTDFKLSVSFKSKQGAAVSCGVEFLCIDPPIKGKVFHYSKQGEQLPTVIDFSEIDGWVHPEGLAIHPQTGNLYIADSGPSQCIWIYSPEGEKVGRFGELGGVYSGRPGEIKPKKFNHPIDVEFDPEGNLFVLGDAKDMNFWGGTELRKFNPEGELVWERFGIEYTTLVDFDPAGDGEELWGADQHYVIDYDAPIGEHWRYAAYTANRFKYPNDPRRIYGINSGSQVRRIEGERITYVESMGGGGRLGIFRYEPDSDIAIPCGMFVPQNSVGTWGYWHDGNGDAERQADEVRAFPFRRISGNPWVDSAGDIWCIGNDPDERGKSYIVRLRCQGLNEHGVPIYSPDAVDTWPVEQPVERIRYDAEADALYLAGGDEAVPTFSDRIVVLNRYNDFVKSGGKLEASYSMLLPGWDRVRAVSTGESRLAIFSMGVTDGISPIEPAGDYVFACTLTSHTVLIYEAKTGILVDQLKTGGHYGVNAGWVDITKGMHAMQRSNGEYAVIVEDDAKGMSTLYRWRPDTEPTDTVAFRMRPRLDGSPDRVQLDWRGYNVPLGVIEGYHVYRSAGNGATERLTETPIRRHTYADEEVEVGKTYRYRIAVVNAAGEGELSPSQTIIPQPASAERVTTGRFAPDGFDEQTRGNWRGVYGSEGFVVAGEFSSDNRKNARRKDPDGARVNIPMPSRRSKLVKSSAPVLLQASKETEKRARGYWPVRGGRNTIDLDFQDGETHRVTVYNYPPGNQGTATRIELLDSASGKVLAAGEIIHRNEEKGQYLAWDVTGHVILRLAGLPHEMKKKHGVHGAAGAHIQGIFFD